MLTRLLVKVITADVCQMLAWRKTYCLRNSAAAFPFGVTNIGVRVCRLKQPHYWMARANFEAGNWPVPLVPRKLITDCQL